MPRTTLTITSRTHTVLRESDAHLVAVVEVLGANGTLLGIFVVDPHDET